VWYWSLPALTLIPPPPSPHQHGPLDSLDPLGSHDPLGPLQQNQSLTAQRNGLSPRVGQESQDVQEVQESQEDQECHVSQGRVADVGMALGKSAIPCFTCRGTVYWRNSGGESVCARCHPHSQTPEPCIHEHVDDAGTCKDCGEHCDD
jgi:hypothetical protein